MLFLKKECGLLESKVTAFVETVTKARTSWKKMWEAELQNVSAEQQLIKDQEKLADRFDEEQMDLAEVVEKIVEVATLRARRRAEPLDFVAPEVDPDLTEADLRKALLVGITSGLPADELSKKRLKAMDDAHKVRNKWVLFMSHVWKCSLYYSHLLPSILIYSNL